MQSLFSKIQIFHPYISLRDSNENFKIKKLILTLKCLNIPPIKKSLINSFFSSKLNINKETEPVLLFNESLVNGHGDFF